VTAKPVSVLVERMKCALLVTVDARNEKTLGKHIPNKIIYAALATRGEVPHRCKRLRSDVRRKMPAALFVDRSGLPKETEMKGPTGEKKSSARRAAFPPIKTKTAGIGDAQVSAWFGSCSRADSATLARFGK
jgi:hypothetical protein